MSKFFVLHIIPRNIFNLVELFCIHSIKKLVFFGLHSVLIYYLHCQCVVAYLHILDKQSGGTIHVIAVRFDARFGGC